jgi:hypothetical protein
MGLDPHHPRAVGSPHTVQGWFNGRKDQRAIPEGRRLASDIN